MKIPKIKAERFDFVVKVPKFSFKRFVIFLPKIQIGWKSKNNWTHEIQNTYQSQGANNTLNEAFVISTNPNGEVKITPVK